jgi:nitrite reductase/ring-hydroxylating ferredoxin subunit
MVALMDLRKVCNVSDVPSGEVRRFDHPDSGVAIALYHLTDGFYATDDLCSHGEASLSEGEIDGHDIVCPFHLGAFCIRTGKATAAPCSVPIRTYQVSIVGDDVCIGP